MMGAPRHSKVLQSWANQNARFVDQYFVDSDGHWIWLKPGYYFEATECGTLRGDTVKEMQRDIADGIYRGAYVDGHTQMTDDACRVA